MLNIYKYKIKEVINIKKCNDCGNEKPLTEFYSQNKYSKTRGEWIYYNPECKVCTKKRTRKWAIEHPETVTESNRKMNDKRRDFLKEYKRENTEKYKMNLSKWQKENPDRVKEYNANHKNHEVNTKEWEDCKKYFNHRCAYCGLKIEDHYIVFKGETQLGDFHKEHVEYDGANDLSNCVPSCRSCNSSKRQYSLDEWYNKNNTNYTYERLEKIHKWLNEYHKKYIKQKKQKRPYIRKNK